MKRDMDLCREILRQTEESPTTQDWIDIKADGRSEEETAYHIKLLAEANLVGAIDASSQDGLCFKVTGLTWEGHDFLDASRNDTIWNKAKQIAVEKTGGLSFEAVKIGLAIAIKTAMGVLTG